MRLFGHAKTTDATAAKHTWRCKLVRKDAMLRLHSRLVARRDALRKALNGDLDAYREYAAMNVVGDSVDAAVDTANDEISSQIVEIESRELGQIEHALRRIVEGVYGRCEFCGEQDRRGEAQRPALYQLVHRLPARE